MFVCDVISRLMLCNNKMKGQDLYIGFCCAVYNFRWIQLCWFRYSLDSTCGGSVWTFPSEDWVWCRRRGCRVWSTFCGRTIRALCEFLNDFFFVVSGMEFAHTCHVFRFHDWAMAVESFVFWYKCLCSNAFALIPIAFGLRSHDTARWTCVGNFAETVVVSVARTSFWMLIFVDLQPIEDGVSWCFCAFSGISVLDRNVSLNARNTNSAALHSLTRLCLNLSA